jgi:hypothetical protein
MHVTIAQKKPGEWRRGTRSDEAIVLGSSRPLNCRRPAISWPDKLPRIVQIYAAEYGVEQDKTRDEDKQYDPKHESRLFSGEIIDGTLGPIDS